MRRRLGFLSFLLLASAQAGCHRQRPGVDVDPNAEATVVVDNQAFADMDIFVLQTGERYRLGQATGLHQTRLKIPPVLLHGPTSLRFVADPVGRVRASSTHELVVTPGDEVTLRIPPQ